MFIPTILSLTPYHYGRRMKPKVMIAFVLEDVSRIESIIPLEFIEGIGNISKVLEPSSFGTLDRRMNIISRREGADLWRKPVSYRIDGVTYDSFEQFWWGIPGLYKGMIQFPHVGQGGTLIPGHMIVNLPPKSFLNISVDLFSYLLAQLQPSFGSLHFFSAQEISNLPPPILRDFVLGVWAWQLRKRVIPELSWLTAWGSKYVHLISRDPSFMDSYLVKYQEGFTLIQITPSMDDVSKQYEIFNIRRNTAKTFIDVSFGQIP